MKFIDEKDNEWHVMNEEMPTTTTNVELLKHDGTTVNGEIVVEMSGYYVYLSPNWGSLSDYSHWRFR